MRQLSWLLAAPVFLAANVVTASAWDDPRYRWTVHNISDLGNVTCGRWDTTRPREVCSPWHDVMNTGFVATGVLLALGAILLWPVLGRAVTVLTLAGGTGYAMAGAFPADVDENRHFLAALLVFGPANVAMLVAARRSWTSLALGLTGVAGTVLFLARVDLGFGVGGMERVAVFPFLAWTLVVALRTLGGGEEGGGAVRVGQPLGVARGGDDTGGELAAQPRRGQR